MVNIILGSAGSGKTTTALNILSKLCKEGNNKLMILVPDQSSFDTETAFLDLVGPKLCSNILVFGFSRLCDYVFKETNTIEQNIIDDGVRRIIMSMALDETELKLDMFGKSNNRKSVLDLMLHSLKECKKDNITTEMLRKAAKISADTTLNTKLNETSLVLDAYEALISNTYIDPLERLNRLKNILIDFPVFKDYTIVMDGFSGFTANQLEIIEILMKLSKDFYITINLDKSRRDLDFFATTNRTYKAIKSIAKHNSFDLAPDTILDQGYRYKNDDLLFLERNIFNFAQNKYDQKAENIQLFSAENIYGEAKYVASRIKSLVIEQGYNYRDIAVISRDHSKYSGILDAVFDKYQIPFFMDVPQDIYTRPVVRFICCAIDFILQGFDREALLSLLKTQLLPMSETQIADIENYLFVWDIDGKELCAPFTGNPSGFEAITSDDEAKLEKIEAVRASLIAPLTTFADSTKEATCLEISKALYKLISDFDLQSALNRMFNTDDETLLVEAKEEVKVYNMLMESLDKLVAVTGSKHMTLKKFKEYLDFMIGDIKLSSIPRYQDQVLVGTADRVRLNDPKAVFVIGAIDGEFPSIPQTAGVFTETERRILTTLDVPLTDFLEELTCHEKYLAYSTLTAPFHKLFVTCYKCDYAGNSYSPSSIITELFEIFPCNQLVNSFEVDTKSYIWTEKNAFEILSQFFKNTNGDIEALRLYFSGIDGYKSVMDNISSTLENKPKSIKNKEITEKLFGKDMHISASQLEVYNLCAFRYFCQYGLRAKERRTASIDAMQFGNVVHYFLEKFLKKYNKEAINTLSDEEIKVSIDEILLDFANESFGGLEDKSKSFICLFQRLKQNIFNLIKQIIRQLQFSDFIPHDFELQIGKGEGLPEYKKELDDNHSVAVNGYIDRVDLMELNDDQCYVRIVDYKTGNKEFKLSEILYGINMQMLIYLKSVVENGEEFYGKKLIPTGILYMPSTTADIDGDSITTDEKITAEMDKNFKMNGLILNDEEVINHMDRSGKFIKLPRTIKNGIFSNNVATREQFDYIFKHIDETIISMGNSLFEGKIEAQPLKGIKDGCAYCPYGSVCCFKHGDKYRFKQALDIPDIYKSLGMEVD